MTLPDSLWTGVSFGYRHAIIALLRTRRVTAVAQIAIEFRHCPA
jgi:hypothetical protein